MTILTVDLMKMLQSGPRLHYIVKVCFEMTLCEKLEGQPGDVDAYNGKGVPAQQQQQTDYYKSIQEK